MTDFISRLRDLHMQCDGLSLYAEAADEIEHQKRCVENISRYWKDKCDEIEHLQLCIRDLNGILNEKRAEIERLRADAERYRWLEEHCTSENDNGDKCLVFWCDFENYNDVDAAIDAARAALKEPT